MARACPKRIAESSSSGSRAAEARVDVAWATASVSASHWSKSTCASMAGARGSKTAPTANPVPASCSSYQRCRGEHMKRVAALVALVVLVGLIAGCAISGERKPRAISKSEAPIELSPSQIDQVASGPSTGGNLHVYFVRGQKLREVGRRVDNLTEDAAVLAVLNGPSQTEKDKGLSSAIPSGVKLLEVAREGSSVVVDLSKEFSEARNESLVNAVAQIAYTLTLSFPINGVRFRVAGKDIAVPNGEGVNTTDPVSHYSYPALDPVQLPTPPAGIYPPSTTTT